MSEISVLSDLSRDWQSMKTAPRDGTEIEARGFNWGDRTRGRHRVTAYWNGAEWRDANDEDSTLHYLEQWRANGPTPVRHDHSLAE